MYFMQMQHLHGLHMAMFANAMAGQTYPNVLGTKPTAPQVIPSTGTPPPPPFGFGGHMFHNPPGFSSVPPSGFHNPSKESHGPMDLSVEK